VSGEAKPQMDGWSDKGCRKARKLEIGGARPRTEMVGGDYLSRPRSYMGCSAWE
jgi:hypothetical protein